MKKILHISKYYYPFRGGTEQIAWDCVMALSDIYEQKIVCFNHENGDAAERVAGKEVVRAGCFAKIFSQSLSFSFGKIIKKEITDFKPDVIIFHYPNPFAAHYLLKYITSDSKLILYWHLDIVKQVILKEFFRRQNRKLIDRADKIIATSPNYMEGSKWLSRKKEKCVVIPNCINVIRLQKNGETDGLETKVKDQNREKIICLAIGRHTKYKGLAYLIEASKYLDNRFKIYIAGKGELTPKLQKMALKDNKIIFLGLLTDSELKAYMSAADIFCFPSVTKNEAFGLALAEAMFYEKPAITFTIEGSGVNYVSVNGVTGLEVPNRDAKAFAGAMTRLADEPELRVQFGRAARKRVEDNFLYDSFAENIQKEVKNMTECK